VVQIVVHTPWFEEEAGGSEEEEVKKPVVITRGEVYPRRHSIAFVFSHDMRKSYTGTFNLDGKKHFYKLLPKNSAKSLMSAMDKELAAYGFVLDRPDLHPFFLPLDRDHCSFYAAPNFFTFPEIPAEELQVLPHGDSGIPPQSEAYTGIIFSGTLHESLQSLFARHGPQEMHKIIPPALLDDQLAAAMRAFSAHNFVHGDISAGNVLFDPQNRRIFFIDLEFSTPLRYDFDNPRGTAHYVGLSARLGLSLFSLSNFHPLIMTMRWFSSLPF